MTRARAGENGFTLTEVLVAITLLMIGVLGLLAMIDTANQKTTATGAREAANNLARELIETSRAVPYQRLSQSSVQDELAAQGLEDESSAAGWQIRRRGATFSIEATVCTVDDPSDGLGAHDGAFCGGTAASADQTPDDYKRVTIDLTWVKGGRSFALHQTGFVNNSASSLGPAIRDFQNTVPGGVAGSVVVTNPIASATFTLTTSIPAQGVSWSLDGVPQGDASWNGSKWTFDWPISARADGAYRVSARASDSHGLVGPSQWLLVKLNRTLPARTEGLAAGANSGYVDLEWLPNRERDIVGYRVFRQPDSGPAVEACPLAPVTNCTAAWPTGTDRARFYVVAYDENPTNGSPRASTDSPTVVEARLGDNTPPNPPTNLVATSAGGTTTLTWSAASPADADGDAIRMYRIYRDGNEVVNRYDRTNAADLRYVDGAPGGTAHTYTVTAVDARLGESAHSGEVAR